MIEGEDDDEKEEGYEQIVQRKLRQLQTIQNEKINGLEVKLQDKDLALQKQNEKMRKIEQDFEYNLKVIEARDQEILELSSKMEEFKALIEGKNTQILETKKELEKNVRQLEEMREKERSGEKGNLDRVEEIRQELKFYKSNYNQEQIRNKEMEMKVEKANSNLKDEQASHSKRIEELREVIASERTRFEKELERERQKKKEEGQQIDEMLKRFNIQNEDLRKEIKELKEKGNDVEKVNKMELNEKNQQLSEALDSQKSLEQELKRLTSDYEKNIKFFKEQSERIEGEKLGMSDKIKEIKLKNKNKIKEIKDDTEKRVEQIIKEMGIKERRHVEEIREWQRKSDYAQLGEKSSKERLQEMIRENKREAEDNDQRIGQMLRNLEEDKRQLRNEIQMKDFKEQQIQKDSDTLSRQIKQYEQEVDDLKSKMKQIESENVLLIQELVVLRKQASNQNQDQIPENKGEESFEKLFSEDMGYVRASLMQNASQKQQQVHNQVQPKTSVQYLQRFKELESEIATYKELIDSMTKEMESAKQKMDFTVAELRLSREECLDLRNRLSEQKMDEANFRVRLSQLEIDNKELQKEVSEKRMLMNVKEALSLKEEQLDVIKGKSQRLEKEIANLRKERDSLAQISSNLKSRCIEYEERLEIYDRVKDDGVDVAEIKAHSEVMFERLRNMEDQLEKAKAEVLRWKQIDNDKERIIEELKFDLIQHNRLLKNTSLPALSVVSHYNHMKRQEAQQKMQQLSPGKQRFPKYNEYENIENENYPVLDNRNRSPDTLKKNYQPSLGEQIFKKN